MSTAPHTETGRRTSSRCRACSDALAHCHGTFVQHEDGSWECTEPGCAGPALDHAWVLGCATLGSDCCALVAQAGAALIG